MAYPSAAAPASESLTRAPKIPGRLLVFEQWHGGHFYYYLGQMLPTLRQAVGEVVLAITEIGARSTWFQTQLAPHLEGVGVETTVELTTMPGMSAGPRFAATRRLAQAVDRYQPDYVIVPSGDIQATMLGAHRLLHPRHRLHQVPLQLGLHNGAAGPHLQRRQHLKRWAYAASWKAGGRATLQLVNAALYEKLRHTSLRSRVRLLPDPVPFQAQHAPAECRRRLGLPEDGRYTGLAGMIDDRKAIPQLLAAFARATDRPHDRLLLAGHLHAPYVSLIEQQYAHLVRAGRLIVINRYLSEAEFADAIGALDLVCAPYPGFPHLSSVLLKGVAMGRPALANHCGWSGYMVERFGLGWACDVMDVAAFAATLRRALDEAPGWRHTESIRRLLAFHRPENFAQSWLVDLCNAAGLTPPPVKTWDWVLER